MLGHQSPLDQPQKHSHHSLSIPNPNPSPFSEDILADTLISHNLKQSPQPYNKKTPATDPDPNPDSPPTKFP